MVSMPSRYNEHTYELSSIEQKYVYTDAYSGYAFNQAPPPKPCLHANPINFEPFSDNLYSSWAGISTEEYYLPDHQILQHEQYISGYHYDTTATLYMTGYHAMEYEFNTGLPTQSGLLPGFATGAYPSPHDGSSGVPSYPHTTWSPSEPSVASLSPAYESQWEERDATASVELGDMADEVLQGLGLYDCPELATDGGSAGELYTCYSSLGRGLKLEESFEFRKEYPDEERDDDDDDDEEDDGEDEDDDEDEN